MSERWKNPVRPGRVLVALMLSGVLAPTASQAGARVPANALAGRVGRPGLASTPDRQDRGAPPWLATLIEARGANEAARDALAVTLATLAQTPEPALPGLFRLWDAERIPESWLGADQEAVLDDAQLKVLEDALERQPMGFIRRHLERVAADPSTSARVKGMQLLGAVGSEVDLGLVLRLARLPEEPAVLPRELRERFEESLRQILERAGRGHWFLHDALGTAHPNLRGSMVRSFAAVREPEVLNALASLLEREPDLAPTLLRTIGILGEALPHPVDAGVTQRVRLCLSVKSASVQLAAMHALGSLEDFEAVSELIARLESSDVNQQAAAHRSLKAITGLNYRPDPRLWKSWYEDESEWWERRSSEAFDRLDLGDEAIVATTIQQLARRHYRRHEVALHLSRALDRHEIEIVRLTCDALRMVGSRAAVPALIELLENENPRVWQPALETLQALTGEDLPAESQLWRAAL